MSTPASMVVSDDFTDGTPDAPNATLIPKWRNYIWKRHRPHYSAIIEEFDGTSCRIGAHRFGAAPGSSPVQFTAETTLPPSITADTTYWVHSTGTNTFTVHATEADADAGANSIDFSDPGEGDITIATIDYTPSIILYYWSDHEESTDPYLKWRALVSQNTISLVCPDDGRTVTLVVRKVDDDAYQVTCVPS